MGLRQDLRCLLMSQCKQRWLQKPSKQGSRSEVLWSFSKRTFEPRLGFDDYSHNAVRLWDYRGKKRTVSKPPQSATFHASNSEAESCRSQFIHVAAETGPLADRPLLDRNTLKQSFFSGMTAGHLNVGGEAEKGSLFNKRRPSQILAITVARRALECEPRCAYGFRSRSSQGWRRWSKQRFRK